VALALHVRFAPSSAALVGLLRCASFKLLGDVTLLPGTLTRGDMATVIVAVSEPVGYRFKQSGFARPSRAEQPRWASWIQGDGLSRELEHGALGEDDGVSEHVEAELYRFTLVKERRPPLGGCWLIKEIMPMRHHMLFAGDSGGC